MTVHGDIRIYFNKRGPLPWSVDQGIGTPEYQVLAVTMDHVNGRLIHQPEAGDNVGTPTAWIEAKGWASIRNERCYVRGE